MTAEPLRSTPEADGFRMPGEFEPHAGTWMAWPRRPDNWRDAAAPERDAFAAVAAARLQTGPAAVAPPPPAPDDARPPPGGGITPLPVAAARPRVRRIGPPVP